MFTEGMLAVEEDVEDMVGGLPVTCDTLKELLATSCSPASYDALRLDVDALRHDKESLLSEIEELKAKLGGEESLLLLLLRPLPPPPLPPSTMQPCGMVEGLQGLPEKAGVGILGTGFAPIGGLNIGKNLPAAAHRALDAMSLRASTNIIHSVNPRMEVGRLLEAPSGSVQPQVRECGRPGLSAETAFSAWCADSPPTDPVLVQLQPTTDFGPLGGCLRDPGGMSEGQVDLSSTLVRKAEVTSHGNAALGKEAIQFADQGGQNAPVLMHLRGGGMTASSGVGGSSSALWQVNDPYMDAGELGSEGGTGGALSEGQRGHKTALAAHKTVQVLCKTSLLPPSTMQPCGMVEGLQGLPEKARVGILGTGFAPIGGLLPLRSTRTRYSGSLWWKSGSFLQHPEFSNPKYSEDCLVRIQELGCPFNIGPRSRDRPHPPQATILLLKMRWLWSERRVRAMKSEGGRQRRVAAFVGYRRYGRCGGQAAGGMENLGGRGGVLI